MRISVAFLFALMFVSLSSVAKAAEPKDVEQVVSLMYNSPNVMARKTYPDKGVQIVFVANGLRYTLYHSGLEGKLNFLSVWVRPNGTSGQKSVQTFTDHGLDGKVDFGINGNDGPDSVKQYFDVEQKKGEEFRPYWQGLYDRTIKDALRGLKRRK